MIRNKKILTLVLALVMVLGAFSTVFAAAATPETTTNVEVTKVTGRDNKIQYLIDNKYVEGRKVNEDPADNDLALDKNIKRSEITKLLVYAIGRQDLAEKLQGAVKIYPDVDTTYWANGVITVGTTMASPANAVAMLNGYPDGTFKPERDVTYAELAKMLVVLVKKDLTVDMANKAVWPSSWLAWAAELGILEDVTIADANKAANRADAFVMLYNALYRMRYIHKLPANETMGIISQLKNNELTLNQGSYEKKYKLTNETTFVLYNQSNTLDVNADVTRPVANAFTQAIRVSAINNPSYYYGSLVRVLTDGEGNVTHILELGNPRYLALGHRDDNIWEHRTIADVVIDANNRWRDIADATVETSLWREWRRFAQEAVNPFAVAAKINYDGGAAKSIDFVQGKFVQYPQNATAADMTKWEADTNNFRPLDGVERVVRNIRLTNATKYYVADVTRNQLTQVASVDEAIRILGLTRASNWFFDVYAGYNKYGDRPAHETSSNANLLGYNEATVVVFNSVQKENNAGELLRVKNETTSRYNITLENTKGQEVVNNLAAYRNAFPFNFGTEGESAKLDVVKYTLNNAYGAEAEMKIDHSDKAKFPVVEVTELSGRRLVVKDRFGDTARLYLDTEYAEFIEGQLKVGALLQFRTLNGNEGVAADFLDQNVNATNTIEIVSIMPASYTGGLQGSVRRIVEGNEANQFYGKIRQTDIKKEDSAGNRWWVTIDLYRNLYNLNDHFGRAHAWLNASEKEALDVIYNYLGTDIVDVRVKVKPEAVGSERWVAYDIEVLVKIDGKDYWRPITELAKVITDGIADANAAIAAYAAARTPEAHKDAVDAIAEVLGEDNQEALTEELARVKDAVDKIKAYYNNATQGNLDAANAAVAAITNAAAKTEAQAYLDAQIAAHQALYDAEVTQVANAPVANPADTPVDKTTLINNISQKLTAGGYVGDYSDVEITLNPDKASYAAETVEASILVKPVAAGVIAAEPVVKTITIA